MPTNPKPLLSESFTHQQGFVAFLDILGYQSFLENNPAAESALAVLKIINTVPAQEAEDFGRSWIENESNRRDLPEKIRQSCRHLIFSDTIVISVTHPADASLEWRRAALAYICMYTARICGVMFMNGLPLRGSITSGSFVSVESCLAGSAVVTAYKLCNNLDYAGIVLSQQISKEYNPDPASIFQTEGGWFTPKYLSPLKNSTEDHFENLNWVMMLHESYRVELMNDISGTTHRTFWGHNKDIPSAADRKLVNTIKAIRFLCQHCPPPDDNNTEREDECA